MKGNGQADVPEFYSAKQLAAIFKRHKSWIYSAKAKGFPMPGGRSTIEALVFWLSENPRPRAKVRPNASKSAL
jgi:hypothetical protein